MQTDQHISFGALGLGAYSPPEAARLLKISPRKVRRWAAGYDFKGRAGALRFSEPIIRADREPSAGFIELTFLDLIEMLFVRDFLALGVSMQTIRKASETAAEILGVERHPFCVKGFKTYGRDIFAHLELTAETLAPSERYLLDLGRRQSVFRTVIEPYLRQFEYDLETDLVRRWTPDEDATSVVIDPAVNFGMPFVKGFGVSTQVLYAQAQAGQKLDAIAGWYEIPVKAVEDAVSFERRLDA
jgi:uncharacterized protein (DUF433 family)